MAVTAKTVENIAAKELKRVRPGGVTRPTKIQVFQLQDFVECHCRMCLQPKDRQKGYGIPLSSHRSGSLVIDKGGLY